MHVLEGLYKIFWRPEIVCFLRFIPEPLAVTNLEPFKDLKEHKFAVFEIKKDFHTPEDATSQFITYRGQLYWILKDFCQAQVLLKKL